MKDSESNILSVHASIISVFLLAESSRAIRQWPWGLGHLLTGAWALWSPVLLCIATSIIIPSFIGYFFNLSAANYNHLGCRRARARASRPGYTIDPLTFSIVKALITFVVYNQGVTFGGLVDELAVARINSALYGGWKGVVAGSAITGVTAIYDAVLKK